MKLASPKAWDTEEGPPRPEGVVPLPRSERGDRKSTRLNSSHGYISYAVFCLKKKQFYDTPIFWEHGVFRQTVFHAHLHCFPFGESSYDMRAGLHGLTVQAQDDIRRWYTIEGHYFYLEDAQNALLFAPEMDAYRRILQEVLWPGAASHSTHKEWRSPQQRIED